MAETPAWDPCHMANVPHPVGRDQIIGHDRVMRDFLGAWATNKIHQAWLLTGPKGVGKASVAYAMAKFLAHMGEGQNNFALVSETDLSDTPIYPESWSVPNDSSAVRRLIAGSHADFIPVVRSLDTKTKRLRRDIGVDDIRNIGKFTHLTAGEGAWRVIIIDSADDMNRNAANALLKILEEPPAATILFLISHRPGRLLPTIRSRCQKVSLRPLTEDQLEAVIGTELDTLNAQLKSFVVALSDGSPGQALKFMSLDAQPVLAKFLEFALEFPVVDWPRVHEFSDMLNKGAAEAAFNVFCDVTRWWVHRVSRAYTCGHTGRESYPGETKQLQAITNLAPLDRWLSVWEKLEYLFDRVERVNLERKQVILSIFTEMAVTVRA